MSSPRIEVDLHRVRHNTRIIVARLKARGIGVTAVTKAHCGHPAIARAILDGGATGLAEARLRNVKRLRQAGIKCPITMIRTPMLSQVDEIVRLCEESYNTEPAVITALAAAALRQGKVHGILLMVEMGDLREGILPQDLGKMARQVANMPGVALAGIGANFACLSTARPTAAKMRKLSLLAHEVEAQAGFSLRKVSGGNSSNLPWALGKRGMSRINDLRLGEAILLGLDPVSGRPIAGMLQDAFTLVAEVIEAKEKSAHAFLKRAKQDNGGKRLKEIHTEGRRIILAIGRQDTDVAGLSMTLGQSFIGATSDHLVIGTEDQTVRAGSELRFQMSYSALMRAMSAPDIQIDLRHDKSCRTPCGSSDPSGYLEVA